MIRVFLRSLSCILVLGSAVACADPNDADAETSADELGAAPSMEMTELVAGTHTFTGCVAHLRTTTTVQIDAARSGGYSNHSYSYDEAGENVWRPATRVVTLADVGETNATLTIDDKTFPLRRAATGGWKGSWKNGWSSLSVTKLTGSDLLIESKSGGTGNHLGWGTREIVVKTIAFRTDRACAR